MQEKKICPNFLNIFTCKKINYSSGKWFWPFLIHGVQGMAKLLGEKIYENVDFVHVSQKVKIIKIYFFPKNPISALSTNRYTDRDF